MTNQNSRRKLLRWAALSAAGILLPGRMLRAEDLLPTPAHHRRAVLSTRASPR